MSPSSSPKVHFLSGSPAEAPQKLEGFAAQARLLRATTPLPERAACALIELEHHLETTAALMVADQVLADAEGLA